ncbi:TetR/AcrR family transcriptional regulator C-terminal domain-containing protein [Sanguibacter sp. 25GB23B1]|uniref:TetR/AcrR family transcriptional regulator n=1 Tax=unclassified Sanguibacter TaxID=2645534 RepID=UPI0032AFC0CB
MIPPEETPERRASLDRAQVLQAGIALADRAGFGALSMRALATELGVVPMALYKHVSDKDDLVGGMIDTLVEGYVAPPESASWQAAVRAQILEARRTLIAHRWLRTAIESRTRRTPAVLAYMNSLAGRFITGGLSVDLTHHAMHALGHRIWGFSPEAFDEPVPAAGPPDPETLRRAAETYPYIVAIVADTAARPSGACDEGFEFEFTLDLLLDAFARLHESGWASQPASPPAT